MAPKPVPMAVSVAVLGVLYQVILFNVLFVVIGIDRKRQSIDGFPYICKWLTHPLLQSCEDLLLVRWGGEFMLLVRLLRVGRGRRPSQIVFLG